MFNFMSCVSLFVMHCAHQYNFVISYCVDFKNLNEILSINHDFPTYYVATLFPIECRYSEVLGIIKHKCETLDVDIQVLLLFSQNFKENRFYTEIMHIFIKGQSRDWH